MLRGAITGNRDEDTRPRGALLNPVLSSVFPCGARQPLASSTARHAPPNALFSATRQFRGLFALIEEMAHCQVGMAPHHPWPGESHHFAHPLSRLRLVTVDGAVRAGRFLTAVRTTIELPVGIVSQLGARFAELRAFVVVETVHRHHGPDCRPFSLDPRWFETLRHPKVQHWNTSPHCPRHPTEGCPFHPSGSAILGPSKRSTDRHRKGG